MEYKLSEASETMTHSRPISWITATTVARSENSNSTKVLLLREKFRQLRQEANKRVRAKTVSVDVCVYVYTVSEIKTEARWFAENML